MDTPKFFSMRRRWIIGNWKMQMGKKQADCFIEPFLQKIEHFARVSIGIAPPFTSIESLANRAKGSFLKIGAQNVSPFAQGAYTGEISSAFLKEVGASFVLIGHSERRLYFQEGSGAICQKIQRALEHGLLPIVCIGENGEERDRGKAEDVLIHQLEGAFKQVSKEQMEHVVIAYEPVWAIGTGKTATPDQVQKIHASIRHFVEIRWDQMTAERLSILYGGSVNSDNVGPLMENPDIDGALVGGASLGIESFVALIERAEGTKV